MDNQSQADRQPLRTIRLHSNLLESRIYLLPLNIISIFDPRFMHNIKDTIYQISIIYYAFMSIGAPKNTLILMKHK